MPNDGGPKDFYTEVPVSQIKPTTTEDKEPLTKLITDPNTAHQLAQTEAQEGVNAALRQEALLKAEHDTGLTELQRKNIQIIEGLKEKYPYAFDQMVSSSGETISFVNLPISDRKSAIEIREATLDDIRGKLYDEGKKHGYPYGGYEETDFAFTKNGVLMLRASGDKNWTSYVRESADDIDSKIIDPSYTANTNITVTGKVTNDIGSLEPNMRHSLKVCLTLANNYNEKTAKKQAKTPIQAASEFVNSF